MARDFIKKSWIFILFFVGLFMFSGIAKAQSCDVPIGLNVTNLSNFSVTLNWTYDNNVDTYRVRYKKIGDSIWQFKHGITGSSQDILNLTQNAPYIWQVKAFCSLTANSPNSSWSVLDTFTTANYPLDCNNTPNGTAYLDSCGNCVGGTTNKLECIDFTPFVNINLSTTDCNVHSDITFETSQDPNEPDISSTFVVSDAGSFDFTGLMTNDVIGSTTLMAGGGIVNISATLMVDFIISPNKISVKVVNDSTGTVESSFTIENAGAGILIVATSGTDNNNITSGNSQLININGLFVNPSPSTVTFTCTINSELGDSDIQDFPFAIACVGNYDCNGDLNGTAYLDSCGNCVDGNTGNIACVPFSPNVTVSLSNTNCDSLTDLTINVSQDPNEADMSTALFASNGGYFDIVSMSVGDTIGSAVMITALSTQNPLTFNTNLVVSQIISSDQAIIQSEQMTSGEILGSFTIENLSSGINITAQSIIDSNTVTSGNTQSATFNNIFVNPSSGTLEFTSTINSEQGDQDVQTTSFNIICTQMCLQQGDANCDGTVNLSDLTLVINNWLQSVSVGTSGDVVGSMDGYVNLSDLTLVINNWLQTTQ
tara:strand:- start:19 stop:1809 length:1791 start_codon:yes stop_codon:yes gene_type:complete